uniref:Uncharacterized protein n=1 Tax=Manihot esculenta TaxID=3983 RepID=A0A2C9U9T1_MANES
MEGRGEHPSSLLNGFHDIIQRCGLFDIPLHWYGFTWRRKRGDGYLVKERLDRMLVSFN